MPFLRIAITADPEIPVPPKHYGGIERIIDLLIGGLMAKGHQVTLFAHKASQVDCELVPYAGATSAAAFDLLRNAGQITRRIAQGHVDLLHSFGRLAYLLPLLPRDIPKLMSYQRHISSRSVRWGTSLSRGSLSFSACSSSMLPSGPGIGRWHVIHNAVPLERYEFHANGDPNAPLVFLGRVEFIKGAHLAIEIAQRSGKNLVIAGNVPENPEHQKYFDTQVRPHLDGKQIRYVGSVDDAQKNELLGQAAALLMPILWEEPFGIVMAEALACGTPVIGLKRGAVPEVVEDGMNGFVCDDVDGMLKAVQQISDIDRSACRRVAEQRFSGPVMTQSYLRVYEQMMNQPAN
jgi:glycosyltransferase involved in cell wall biosynthesis